MPSSLPSQLARDDGPGKPAKVLSALLAPVRAWRGGSLSYRDRYRIAVLLSFLPLRLASLLRLFGSDKQSVGQHSYGATYHELLLKWRYRKVKLREVGILNGESLLAWRAFFPFGTIIGCDIEPKKQFSVGKIKTYLVDQSSRSDLESLSEKEGPFDVIVDDGSHQNDHQILTFYKLFWTLRDGGIYIIEDVQTSFWPVVYGGAHVQDPAFAHSCVGEFLELTKYLNHNEFFSLKNLDERRLACAKKIRRVAFEHNLIIVIKGPNDEDSNFLRWHAKDSANWRNEN
jgi:demethylmacrocin O-methyltransferase